ncbi:hypothetical protein V498_10523 [Pseudogymnoascus sp. VKM F-4517 (FW-2822)]|nr:hypothetical protein V498_10523 [Pseudogymnoascus sp. VKM F-4517 (FW-2822)]
MSRRRRRNPTPLVLTSLLARPRRRRRGLVKELLLRLVVLEVNFGTIRGKSSIIDVTKDQERRDDEEHSLQADGLDELVHDASESVSGDLGAADLRRVGLHADFPFAACGGDGGDAQVRGAVVGGPVGGADCDFVVGVVDGAGFLLGDVGLDGADGGVDEVHGDGDEEGVEDQLRVVGEEVREVGPRLDAAEEGREPVLAAGRRVVVCVRAVAPRVRVAGGAAVDAAAAGVDDGVAVVAAALAGFLGDGVGELAAARGVAAGGAEGGEPVPPEDGFFVELGRGEGRHGYGGPRAGGGVGRVFCVGVVGGGGFGARGFGEEVDVKGFAGGGEGWVAEGGGGVGGRGGEERGL